MGNGAEAVGCGYLKGDIAEAVGCGYLKGNNAEAVGCDWFKVMFLKLTEHFLC